MVYKSGQIFLPFLSGITRVTDRQTDGQMDGRTEISLNRVCITCSAVKRGSICLYYQYNQFAEDDKSQGTLAPNNDVVFVEL